MGHAGLMIALTRSATAAAVMLGVILISSHGAARESVAYVGTYTRGESQGIYAFRFDDMSGELTPLGLAAASEDPSFLVLDAKGEHLYSVSELNKQEGSASAFSLTRGDFHLRLLGRQSTGGIAPCALVVAKSWVFAANYTSGSLAGFQIQPDGDLGVRAILFQFHGSGPNAVRQGGPHAHSAVLDPSSRFLLCCDLGTDRVMVYRLNQKSGAPSAAAPAFFTVPAGSGPRHLVFSADASRIYVVNEIRSSVSVFSWEASEGRATLMETAPTLPAGRKGGSTAAEVQIAHDGGFLYTSNRGDDSLSVFPIRADGRLGPPQTVPCGGRTPRFFTFDPSGKFLLCACQDSGLIQVFRQDAASGQLSPIGAPARVDKPVCIAFAPEG